MWIILCVGLLPLGVDRGVASVDNARDNRDRAQIEARALLAVHAQRFTLALSRNAVMIARRARRHAERRRPGRDLRAHARPAEPAAQHAGPLRPLRRRRRPALPIAGLRRRRLLPMRRAGSAAPSSRPGGERSTSSSTTPAGCSRASPNIGRGRSPARSIPPPCPAISRSSWSRATDDAAARSGRAAGAGPEASAEQRFANGRLSAAHPRRGAADQPQRDPGRSSRRC